MPSVLHTGKTVCLECCTPGIQFFVLSIITQQKETNKKYFNPIIGSAVGLVWIEKKGRSKSAGAVPSKCSSKPTNILPVQTPFPVQEI